MAYRGGNFSFVVEPSFQPFTMQEMLVPFAAYKDAYEKAEEGYIDLSSKADKFKYLSETLPEDSKARQLYEGYAGFLATQAEDLARNGYSIANRGALTSLKRRYQGEIGRLVEADTALKKEQELRRTMNAKDSSMLYAANNLTIDNFLDGSTPNLYSISGNDLYVKGAAAGKAASSRIFNIGDGGSTLGGYYRDWVSKNGYSPERINEFRRNVAAIPELQQAVDDILVEKGVKGNLTGAAYERARQSIINGIIDGAVYTEVHKPEIDRGVMSAAEKAADQRAKDNYNLAKRRVELEENQYNDAKTRQGQLDKLIYTFDGNGNITGYRTDTQLPAGYWLNPVTQKVEKKPKEAQSKEEKDVEDKKEAKATALLKLKNSDLAHNEGFDVQFKDDRQHFDYAGAISRHGDTWYSGALGEDNPGHNFPRSLGWGSTTNVENWRGNYSAEWDSSGKMRIMSESEVANLVKDNALSSEIQKVIENYNERRGMPKDTNVEFQIVEVPNESGGKGGKGYLIAVR